MTASRAVDSLPELVERAASLLSRSGRAILGITGAPGVGKTTLVALPR